MKFKLLGTLLVLSSVTGWTDAGCAYQYETTSNGQQIKIFIPDKTLPFNLGGNSESGSCTLNIYSKKDHGACYVHATITRKGKTIYAFSGRSGSDPSPLNVDGDLAYTSIFPINVSRKHDLLGYYQSIPHGMYTSTKFIVYNFSLGNKKIIFTTKQQGTSYGFISTPVNKGFKIGGGYIGKGQSDANFTQASATWKWNNKIHKFVVISRSKKSLKFASVILGKPIDPSLISWWNNTMQSMQ